MTKGNVCFTSGKPTIRAKMDYPYPYYEMNVENAEAAINAAVPFSFRRVIARDETSEPAEMNRRIFQF